jgi:uncharacterized membrane protein
MKNFLIALFFCSQLMDAAMGASKNYKIVDLIALPESDSTDVRDVNNNGQVLGVSRFLATGSSKTFIWDNGAFIILDPGFPLLARRINEAGHVVGTTDNIFEGFLWDGQNFIPIEGFAQSINNSDHVVGTAVDPSSPVDDRKFLAFLWINGAYETITPSGGLRSIQDLHINDKDQVVGKFVDEQGFFRVFFWDKGNFQILAVTVDFLTGINNKGEVIGYARTGESTSQKNENFIWRKGKVKTVVHEEFIAQDINNRGQIVGGHYLYNKGNFTFFGDIGEGIVENLEDIFAVGINDRGQIIGEIQFEGTFHGFIAEPVKEKKGKKTVLVRRTGNLIRASDHGAN